MMPHTPESIDDYKVPSSKCPTCGYLMDHVTNVRGKGPSDSGSFTICLNCGQTLIFEADLTLRRLIAFEIELAMTDHKAWATIEKAQAYIRKRGPLPTMKKAGAL